MYSVDSQLNLTWLDTPSAFSSKKSISYQVSPYFCSAEGLWLFVLHPSRVTVVTQFRTFLEEDDIMFPSPTSINHGLTWYVHQYQRIPTIVSWAEWMEAHHRWFTGRFDDKYQGLTPFESQLIRDAAPQYDLDTYWVCRELGIPQDDWRRITSDIRSDPHHLEYPSELEQYCWNNRDASLWLV